MHRTGNDKRLTTNDQMRAPHGSGSWLKNALACRRSADCFNRYGQLDNEAAANRLIFFDADRTMMVFHNSAHNRQAQSGAALLGREVRQEQAFLNVARNPLPGV